MMEREGAYVDPDAEEQGSPKSFLKRLGRKTIASLSSRGDVFAVTDDTRPTLERLIKNPLFEIGWIFMIIASTVALFLEAQYYGMQSGYDNDLGHIDMPSAQNWPGAL